MEKASERARTGTIHTLAPESIQIRHMVGCISCQGQVKCTDGTVRSYQICVREEGGRVHFGPVKKSIEKQRDNVVKITCRI